VEIYRGQVTVARSDGDVEGFADFTFPESEGLAGILSDLEWAPSLGEVLILTFHDGRRARATVYPTPYALMPGTARRSKFFRSPRARPPGQVRRPQHPASSEPTHITSR
jgi:hypothetical protein